MSKLGKLLKGTALGMSMLLGAGAMAPGAQAGTKKAVEASGLFKVENVAGYETDGKVQFKCADTSTAAFKRESCDAGYQFIQQPRGRGNNEFARINDAFDKKNKRLKSVFEAAKAKAPLPGGFKNGDVMKCKKDFKQTDFTCKQFRPK